MKFRAYLKWIATLMVASSCNTYAATAQYSTQLDLNNLDHQVVIEGQTANVAADIVRFDLGSGWNGEMDIQLTTGTFGFGTTLGFALTTDPNDSLYNNPSPFLALSNPSADVNQFFNDNVAGWELYSWGNNYVASDTTNDITGSLGTRTFDPNTNYYAFVAGGSIFPTDVDVQLDVSDGNDVSAVPVPAAVWLFGSGLLGFASYSRRNKRLSNDSNPI
ncbi:MAG: hypothetical protein P8163_05725 [Candidatus Thiodiazotropha sp.]